MQSQRQFSKKWLQGCSNKIVLDVGCGKSVHMWFNIKPKKLVGLDIDPTCIFRSQIVNKRGSYIWFDFTENWNIRSQINNLSSLWNKTQMYKFRNFQIIYDYIVFNFSIHYSTDLYNLIKILIDLVRMEQN